jgi:hypothetical protein
LVLRGQWQEAGEDYIMRSFYASPNIITLIKSRRIKLAGPTARMGGMRKAHKILVRKPEGKRSYRRPGHRCEDNIRMGLIRVVWEGEDWIHPAQDRGW